MAAAFVGITVVIIDQVFDQMPTWMKTEGSAVQGQWPLLLSNK